MSEKRIFRHTFKLEMGPDATPEMREWFDNNYQALLAAFTERVEPLLIKCAFRIFLKMEINQLGFSKQFPLEKELG